MRKKKIGSIICLVVLLSQLTACQIAGNGELSLNVSSEIPTMKSETTAITSTTPVTTTTTTVPETTAITTTVTETTAITTTIPNTALSVNISDTEITVGEILTISVLNSNDESISLTSDLNYSPEFYTVDEGKLALLPVHFNTEIREHIMTVTVGEDEVFEFSVNVVDREFNRQDLTVDKGTASDTINNDNAIYEWNTVIEPLKKVIDPQKYWEGEFLQPITGKVTTEFGTIRYVNGEKTSTRHTGIDLAAPAGTPVPAANTGKVIFSKHIQLTGNTVIIEHGMGLKSWYFHMNSLNVKENDIVKKGDIIGTVGSTGFSTGPHLHFEISVNKVFINPWTSFKQFV